jgi:putative restriction endonuclease
MKYWWVNQSGSHKFEHSQGFMWSPMKEINGARNQGYENMKNVSPGDVVFSNVDAHIVAIGRVQSYSQTSERPAEFPKAQNTNNHNGWRKLV